MIEFVLHIFVLIRSEVCFYYFKVFILASGHQDFWPGAMEGFLIKHLHPKGIENVTEGFKSTFKKSLYCLSILRSITTFQFFS